MANPPQLIPLNIMIAPFPQGFQGDMDETFQQATQLMSASVEGNFLTGLILPPGSTLPTNDQGPIAVGNVWYFWDPATGQYLPQTVSTKAARNYVKNPVYQIQQTGSSFSLSATGITKTYDMAQCRATQANIVNVGPDTGPLASGDNDYCPAAIKFTVGPSLLATPAAGDWILHEHLVEGTDIAMLQGQPLSLSFSVWTNTPGTYSYALLSTGRDASYVGNYTITPANTWTRIKVPAIPALPTGTGTWNFSEGQTGLYIVFPFATGANVRTATLNSWQAGSYIASTTSGNLCTVVNNQLEISGVKLEASPQVSYLSVPSRDQDYWDCIRYYFTTFVYQSVTSGVPVSFVAYAAGAAAGSLIFPKRMCKVPTVVPYSPSTNTAGTVRNISGTPADVTVATLPATAKGTGSSFALTGAAVGNVALANIVADARLT
jgi:hypothetical protein